jgi:hypothetical protein
MLYLIEKKQKSTALNKEILHNPRHDLTQNDCEEPPVRLIVKPVLNNDTVDAGVAEEYLKSKANLQVSRNEIVLLDFTNVMIEQYNIENAEGRRNQTHRGKLDSD